MPPRSPRNWHPASSIRCSAKPPLISIGAADCDALVIRFCELREPFLVALPPEHRLAGERSVRLRDLADDDWTAAFTDGLIVRACRDAGFEPRLVSITRDQLAIRGLITRGLAVTLAPRLLAEAFSGTALRPIAGKGPERDVYALLPPGARHPLVPSLLDALVSTAAELQG